MDGSDGAVYGGLEHLPAPKGLTRRKESAMCGIAGVYLLDADLKVSLDSMLDTLLDGIEHRGGDATGYVALGTEGVLEWQKAACGAKDFGKYRRPVPKGTTTILAHTRWATQGLPAFAENNHPLKRGSFYAIHNGHVSNDHKLFELAGRDRYGQVDSEAIPARLASLGKLDALSIVMEEIQGGAAVAAVDENHPQSLALARGNSSPLFVLRTKKIVLFGSTPKVVEDAYTQHVGALPKKAKIENVAEGTMLLWHSGTLKRVKFTPYNPPVVWRMPNITLPWKEVFGTATPKELPASTGWDTDDEDVIACDSCGVVVGWQDAEYRQDADDDGKMTWQLCPDCVGLYDYEGTPIGGSVYDAVDFIDGEIVGDDLDAVNQAILDGAAL
jgi:predicted glutamine amidotransferase